MKKTLWKITLGGSVLGCLILIITLFAAESAPQEASGAAIAMAFSIIPYCMARALSEMSSQDD